MEVLQTNRLFHQKRPIWDQQDKDRSWLNLADPVALPPGTNQNAFTVEESESEWLSELDLIVERLVKVDREPIVHSLRRPQLTCDDALARQHRSEALILVEVFEPDSGAHDGFGVLHAEREN